MEKLLGSIVWNKIIIANSGLTINEIRLRINKPILIKYEKYEQFIDFIPDKNYLENIINRATNNSLYAYENEISDGYLEYGNGIRIGICGKGKINNRNLIAFSNITSICIRIPNKIALLNNIKQYIIPFQNTLIIGPPYSGKTTLIRAIGNYLAEKKDVIFIDERKEIAGEGLKFIEANRADIIQGIPKKFLFENLIRSMSPHIVVCDELFSDEDMVAVKRIIGSGIKCLASFHSDKIQNIPHILNDIFSVFILLNSNPTPGSIVSIVRKDD